MIALFMVMSFVIGCVYWICQSFLSGCVVFFSCFFFNHRFCRCCYGFFYLSLPVGDKFFQSDDTECNCQLVIELRQDLQVIILCWQWDV